MSIDFGPVRYVQGFLGLTTIKMTDTFEQYTIVLSISFETTINILKNKFGKFYF